MHACLSFPCSCDIHSQGRGKEGHTLHSIGITFLLVNRFSPIAQSLQKVKQNFASIKYSFLHPVPCFKGWRQKDAKDRCQMRNECVDRDGRKWDRDELVRLPKLEVIQHSGHCYLNFATFNNCAIEGLPGTVSISSRCKGHEAKALQRLGWGALQHHVSQGKETKKWMTGIGLKDFSLKIPRLTEGENVNRKLYSGVQGNRESMLEMKNKETNN